MLQDLLPPSRGGAKTYEKYAVDDLPDDSAAGGIRPGVANAVACCMPVEFGVRTTGHECRVIAFPLAIACPCADNELA